MKTLHTIYTNFAKRNLARFLTVFTILFTIGIGQILGATARYTWDLTSSSANWTSSNCETYFSQPYGMKKKDAYIINKNIDDFKQYAATATSIQIGVKSLCNGATTSKLTIYLVDKDGNTVGSGMEITPDDKSSASNTTYKYVTFTSNLSIATGYKIQCTTFGKNVLVNGSSYEITYDDSSSGSGNTGGGNDSDGCTWELVTDASTLAAGDRIVIAAAGYDYAMGDNSSNGEYRIRTAITKNENKIAITNDVQIIILEEGTKTNTFAFNVDDSYLYASSSSSNQLKTKSTLDNNGSWSITIANGGVATIKAQGDKTRNWIRYNANSTQERFSCYGSGQSDVVIYKEICAKEVTITLNPDGGTGTFADWITSGDNYTMTVDAGTEITLPELSKTGYNFDGWHDGKATVTSLYTPTKEITLTAQWTAQQYNIIYKDQGNADYSGENIAYLPKSHTYDQTTTLVAGVKTGYTFDGWYKEPACTNKVTTLGATDYTSDITLYAQWTPNTYTVQFDANEGTGEMDNQSFTYDAEPTSLSANIFERVGYNFNGWNTADDGSGTSYADKEEVKNLTAEPNSVVTLYAQWTAKKLINYRTLCTYNIVLKNNYGDDDSKDGLATITSTHTKLSISPAPSAREGYMIEGYYAEPECTIKVADNNGNLMASVTNYTDADGKWIGGETILYTKWTGRTYTVTLDDNGGSGGSGTITATYGSPMPVITLPTRTGYTFNGYWTGKTTQSTKYYDANGSSLKNWDKAGNTTTLYALWTANTNTPYVVKHYKELLDGTYPAEADDTDNLTGTTAASVTPAVNSYEGFTAPSTQTVSIAADGSTVVTYQYTRNSYNLSWNVNEGDALTGEYTSGNVKYEAAITQPNTPTRTDYTFIGWSPAEIPATMPANNLEFIAQWAAIHTVTWMVNGSQAEGDPTTSVVNGQTITTLPTIPDVDCNGKVFVGWTTAEIVGEIATRPDPLYTELGNFPVVTSNMTFYAVFANGSGDERWVETEIGEIQSGDEVVVMMAHGTNLYALPYDKETASNSNPAATTITLDDFERKIVDELIWYIQKDHESNNFTLSPKTATDKYLTCNSSKNAVRINRGENRNFTIENDFLKNIAFSTYLAISTTAETPDWRHFVSTNTTIVNRVQTLKFYKKTIEYTSYTNYSTSCMAGVCDITNANPIYVTSAVGQKIKATDKLVLTTTDMAVGTEISLSAPNITFYKEGVEITQLTTTAASETFELEIAYQPTISNTTEQPTITLEILGYQFTFNNKISCRSLPENFVIATKVGATWYALPANMNGATNPEGVVIDVDETTMTATAPNTTVYTLFPVATVNGNSDRYKEYGERLRFAAVNNGNRGLWANDAKSGTTINNDAAITAANSTAGAAYEWKITTTIVDGNWQYTLQTDQSNNQKYLRYWTAASGGAKWGTYASGNDKLYFLPVTTYTDLDLEVMEWGTNSMVIRAGEDLPQNVNITINGTKTPKTLQNINGSDLYKIDDVTLTSDDCGTIIIDNGSNARKIIRKPLLVSGNRSGSEYTTSPGRDICAECDIVILNGGQLIADEAKSTGSHVDFANIYVYPGGKLVLDGKSLGVKRQVYLRGGYSWINQTTYDLPEVYVNGDINFNGSGNIIYDYYIQNYKYYQFSLPYQVPLAKVTDEAGVDNFPVWVKHYNGALRAADANATSWEWYSGDNFEAGIGYIIAAKPRQEGKVANRPLSIIRFPLDNSVISSAEADKSIATTAHGIVAYNAGTITANNVGWNFIGNPFMATWKGDIGHQQLMKSPDAEHWNGSYHWENNAVKYITVMSPKDGTDYDQYIAANTKLKPFFPFYLQETADGGAGTINFAAANRIQKAPAELYADEPREAFVQVEILTDRVEDQTGVFISDTYSDDIDFDDYEKIFGSSLEKSKLWFIHEDKRMAFEAMTEASAAANIALGYRAPRLGKYTFAINEDVSALNEVVGVYLTDHELGVTDYNLLYNTYEFETEATNYNDQRFTIRITLRDDSNGVVTGVDNIGTMNDGIYKFIYQDKMYIYNDGIIYDATGKQVTNINK